tara:strand:- start:152 stop:424 length:273 start_codon:yes stop_codon:yes gene_type:complete
MAHTTVIKADTAIYEDGNGILGCDMSGLPNDLHTLQWDGSKGHIEWTNSTKSHTELTASSQIKTHLGISLSELISRRTTRKTEIEKAFNE